MAFWSCALSFTAARTAEQDVTTVHKQINEEEFDVEKRPRGVSLSCEFFRHAGYLFVLVICVLQSVTSLDVDFHLPHSLALLPSDLSWIFTPLLQVCTFMHVAAVQQQEHLYVFLKLEMSHTQWGVKKLLFFGISTDSYPPAHSHINT